MTRRRTRQPVSTIVFQPRTAREVYHHARTNAYASMSDDPFAINPVRRSFFVSAGSWATIVVPAAFFNGDLQALILIGFGWLAAAGIIFVTPIFFWSVAEHLWGCYWRRRRPVIDQLDISPRAKHVLQRHGFETIESVDRASDATLMLLSNMDARTLQDIRRAVNLWKYQRWQERGFPLSETPDSYLRG